MRWHTSGRTRRKKVEDSYKSLSKIPGTIYHDLSKQNKSLTNVFLLSNNDRFGDSVQTKRPKDMLPPPGYYDSLALKSRTNGAALDRSERITFKTNSNTIKYKVPGPAYYKPATQPRFSSYHLNVQNHWM